MYYVWQGDYKLVDHFSFFRDDPIGLDIGEFRSANKIVVDPPILELITDSSYPAELSDLLLTEFALHIVSPRLVQVFDSLSIENVQFFPIRIRNHETGKVNDEYKILNLIGAIDCLDFDSADFEISRKSGEIIMLEEYKLLPDKITDYSDGELNKMIFRLGEFKWHLLIQEEFKLACEKSGITGCRFTSTEEYA